MNTNKLAPLAFACLASALTRGSFAAVIPLTSISQVSIGTTLTFEGLPQNVTPSVALSPYGITTNAFQITGLGTSTTGNANAPISGSGISGTTLSRDPLTFTPNIPWFSVGFSVIGSVIFPGPPLTGTINFTFDAYDQSGQPLYETTRTFAPTVTGFFDAATKASFNASAFFVGLSSDTPIAKVTLSGTNPNFAIDSFTFIPTAGTSPEPGTLPLTLSLGALLLRRSTKRATPARL